MTNTHIEVPDADDVKLSIRRTFVPIVAGSIVSALAVIGLDVDPELFIPLLTGLFIGVWYSLARFLETRKGTSWFDSAARMVAKWMLGSNKQPTYHEPEAPEAPAEDESGEE